MQDKTEAKVGGLYGSTHLGDGPINLMDFEALARAKMPAAFWDYYEGGAEDEYSVAENVAAYRRIKLRPRVLRDVRQRSLATSVLGQRVAMPVLLAPTSFQKLAHAEGELATARAAAAAGVVGIFGTGTHHTIGEIAATGAAPRWFQLYCYEDRTITERVLARAEAAGCLALVVTVDAVYPSRRERHMRTPFVIPSSVRLGNLDDVGLANALSREDRPLLSLTWADVDWLRSLTRLPIVLKGIMTAEDALLAVEHGVAGIVVSNHGGRQIDGTLATIEALPEVVAAVAGRVEVLVDGGVRRGTDVLKALALGARAVLLGRPFLWGLAADGEAGVLRVLTLLRDEIDNALAQCGIADVQQIERSLVAVR